MSAIIARRTATGFAGKPILDDPGPGLLGEFFWWWWGRARNHNWRATRHRLLDCHHAGFRWVPPEAASYGYLHCLCHGNGWRTWLAARGWDRPLWDGLTITEGNFGWALCRGDHVGWAYVLDEQDETLTLLQAHRIALVDVVERPHLAGLYMGVVSPSVSASVWRGTDWFWAARCEVPLDGPEPDWRAIEQTAPGDAPPWPYTPPGEEQPAESAEWWQEA